MLKALISSLLLLRRSLPDLPVSPPGITAVGIVSAPRLLLILGKNEDAFIVKPGESVVLADIEG